MQDLDIQRARQQAKSRRKGLDKAERVRASTHIHENLLKDRAFQEAQTVMLYASFRDEVCTEALFPACLAAGKRVFFPRCRPDAPGLMDICPVTSDADLRPGAFGIPEPQTPPILNPVPDWVLVPGLAFDRRGFRLGYGGGYYDRFLSTLPPTSIRAGLAFDLQIVECLPTRSWDIPVHCLFTPSTVLFFKEHLTCPLP